MSEQEQNEHAWFGERMAVALAGGLDAAEKARFDAHAAACASCAAELGKLEALERQMSGLFALPRAGLEDRVIETLRTSRDRWRLRIAIHPAVQRAALATAAVLVLAGFGYLADQRIEGDGGPTFVKVASNLQQIGQGINLYSNDNRGTYPRDFSPSRAFRSSMRHVDEVPAKESETVGPGFRFSRTLGTNLAVAADQNPSPTAAPQAAQPQPHPFGDQKKTLYDDTLRYPRNWPDVSGLRDEDTNAPKLEKGIYTNGAHGWEKKSPANSESGNVSGGKQFGGETVGPPKQAFGRPSNVPETNGPDSAKENAPEAGFGMDGAVNSAGDYFKPTAMAADTATPGLAAAAMDSLRKRVDVGGVVSAGKSVTPVEPPVAVPEVPAPAKVVEQPADVAPITRKVIRNGQMEFEVDRFEAAFAQASKLTTEAGGYIGTTNSEKLPNGKVKGTITLRVPPDRLDTLVLQLRGIGDLKSQKLDANDVTKQYTDLESELRADKAMEERLLAMIKDGKGQIKELLMAEKELGNWRQKIEKIVGEMRYFDNQVAMSTLQITLYERDIKTPATAKETESIDAGVEAEDVEKARADALKAIEDAKGRVIQSELKKYDAGQFGATIVAEVPPDAAGPLVDRLKQIGKMARLEIQRKQTGDANGDSAAPVRVEKQNSRLNLSLYNLANVAPRTTSTINLAAEDVGKTYRAILDRVTKAGRRVVSSSLAQNKPEQTTGQISFEAPAADADAVTNDLRGMGEVMKLSVTDNPDVNNVTTAKRGFALQLIATAAVAPRETQMLQVAAASVSDAREKILAAASAGGARVLVSQLSESDRNHPSAAIEVDVPRGALVALEKAIAGAGDVVSRSVSRSNDTENVLDTKVKLQISLMPADQLPPRETTALTIESGDVDAAIVKLQQDVAQAGGRVVESNLSKDGNGATRGTFSFEAPLDKAQSLIDEAKQQGVVRAAQSSKNLQGSAGALAKARVDLSLMTPEAIVEPGTGPWATIRNGWATSVKALLWSLELVVIGLCTVLPFCLVIWGGWRLFKRRSKAAGQASS